MTRSPQGSGYDDSARVAERSFRTLVRGLGGDRGALADFADQFTEHAVLWLPAAPDTKSPCVGRAAIRQMLFDRAVNRYHGGLDIDLYQVLASDPGETRRVAFQFESRGTLADGTPCADSPVITLDVRGGAIAGLWEYRGGPRFFADAGPPVPTDRAAEASARVVAEQSFACLQRGLIGDAGALGAFTERLDEHVRLWFPPTPNTRSPYVGRSAVERVFRDVIIPLYPAGLFVRRFRTLTGGLRTAFELQSYGVRRDGSEYVNSPMLALDVRGDRIMRIWEHWGGPGFFDPAVRVSSVAAPAA